MTMKDEKSGKWVGTLLPGDKKLLENMVEGGTTKTAFIKEVMTMFMVSVDTASSWYYKARRKSWEYKKRAEKYPIDTPIQ